MCPCPATTPPRTHTLRAQLRGGRHTPPAAQTEKYYKHLQQLDKTVYCGSPSPPPPRQGEAGMAWGAFGPRPGHPLFAQVEVFSSEGSLSPVSFVVSATEISCLCYSLLQQDHLKPKTFIAPFKKALQLPIHLIPCPALGAAIVVRGLGGRSCHKAGPGMWARRDSAKSAGSPRV